ncbi:unnamed protein product, partial [Phaeothamnion confervicola]
MDQASTIAALLFGLTSASVESLPSYDDNNFKITASSGDIYTLKVQNGVESEDLSLLEAQSALAMRLNANGCTCPAAVATAGG